MVLTWSVVAAVAAFVVLVIGTLITFRSVLSRLGRMQQSAETMQQDLHQLSAKLSGLVQPTEDTIRAAHRQLTAANRLFEAAGQVGGAITHTTSAVEQAASVLSEAATQHANRASTKRQVGDALDWAELGMAAWQLWQTNRKPEVSARKNDSSEANMHTKGES